MNDKIAYIIISVLFSDVHDAGYPISIDPTFTCNHQKNIKNIKRGQGKTKLRTEAFVRVVLHVLPLFTIRARW